MDDVEENQNLIGIFTTDAEFIVQVWDAGLERLTGISAENARGKSIIEIIPDVEARGLMNRFRRVMAEGTVEILAPAFHRFLISCKPLSEAKHFTEMQQRIAIAPLKENEIIRGLIVTIEDVTERIERELELAGQLKNADENIRLRAAKAISHEAEILPEESVAPVIGALGDKNWRVRRELVESLSRRAAPEAIAALLRAVQEQHLDFGVLNSALQVLQATSVKTTETLIQFLRGEDADLRMQAALTLGEQKDSQATGALLAALADENVNVRYHVIEALGKLQAREAVAPLLDVAEMRDFFLSFAALDALRKIGDSSISPRILPLLEVDFLREAAAETLGAVGKEDVIPPLVNLLNEDKSSAVSVAAALNSLFARDGNDYGTSDGIVEKVRHLIDESGKLNLLYALENAGENDLIPLIRVSGWITDEKISHRLAALLDNENLREEAVGALAKQGETAVEFLLEKLKADDSEVRRAAILTLGKSKTERGTKALIEILETDTELASTAAQALGEIGNACAFEPLVDLLQTGDAASRIAVAGALKSLAHPETASRLCDLIEKTEDSRARESALRVLGYSGGAKAEKAIFDCCTDADERVRRAAIEQLSNFKNDQAVSILIRALKQDSPRVREAAAKTLAQVESAEAVAALREALSDAAPWTRYFAVRALGALHDSTSREILFEMVEKDEAEQVRQAAREVLSQLKA